MDKANKNESINKDILSDSRIFESFTYDGKGDKAGEVAQPSQTCIGNSVEHKYLRTVDELSHEIDSSQEKSDENSTLEQRKACLSSEQPNTTDSVVEAGSPAPEKNDDSLSDRIKSDSCILSSSNRGFRAQRSQSCSVDKPKPCLERLPSNASNFRALATQVVSSQRAVKNFKTMWQHIGGQSKTEWLVIGGIHLDKKKLDLRKVAAEYKEVKRYQFYQELLVYAFFLVIFFSLISWLPVYDSYEQGDVVADLTCRDVKSCSLEQPNDIYTFAERLHSQICSENLIHQRWSRVGNLFLRQVRVEERHCSVVDGWEVPCYPVFSLQNEDRSTIIGKNNRVYKWKTDLPPLRSSSSSYRIFDFSLFGNDPNDYGTGGYVINLCKSNASQFQELEEDHWHNAGTRAISIDFVLVNPATRIFTIASHIFSISASGHIQHYSQGANVRLLCYSECLTFILWLCCVGFFLMYLRGEYNEMHKLGFSCYVKNDLWNVFEMVQLLLMGSLLYSIFIYHRQSISVEDSLGTMKSTCLSASNVHVNMYPLLLTFHRLSDYASLTSAISLLKVFKFLRMNSTLNLLWQVLGMALKDLMGFLVIFNLIFISYSFMGHLAFGFDLEEFSTIKSSYATCFHMLAGQFDYEQMHRANPRLAPLFFGSFVVLVFQILVNMFVAILSEYYEVAKDATALSEDIEYDVLNRVQHFLAACSPTVVLRNKEGLELNPGQTVHLISTNLVDREVSRQRTRKLFRGAVWRVVALLRFGVQFDRKIIINKTRSNTVHQENRNDQYLTLHIPLSENFDHKTIKDMLPRGITIRLEGDSLLGTEVKLKVERHSGLSIECKVLDGVVEGAPVELIGGETLRIPWQLFVLHVGRTIIRELRLGFMRATKWWDPLEMQLVDDYHLSRLLNDSREDGRNTLRFDELFRILDLFLRKDRPFQEFTPEDVRRETALVMHRFRKSLIDMPSREKEGHDYRPNPLDTSKIEIGALEYLSEMLAENCHDIWALDRIKSGWTYGESRSDDIKQHPNLVPYHKLSEEEKAFDYRTSIETLKTILSLNFQVTRSAQGGPHYLRNASKSSQQDGSQFNSPHPHAPKRLNSFGRLHSKDVDDLSGPYVEYENGERYYPRPIDTSAIELPKRLLMLVDLLAENAHEVWSSGRMQAGWTYGHERDDKLKKHPCLVPFIFLTDQEKEYDVNTAMGTLKMLLAMGFNVSDSGEK